MSQFRLRSKYPVAPACPACGSADHRRVKPATSLAFADDRLGLRTVLCYETVPGTDVILRWTEHTARDGELRLERFDSAAVTLPMSRAARLFQTCSTEVSPMLPIERVTQFWQQK